VHSAHQEPGSEGVEVVFVSLRCDPSRLRPDHRLFDPTHLVRHEQVPTRGRGLRASHRQAGRCDRHIGPGATNIVTALADAYMDSIPLVVITGQVATAAIGTDAFQEVDTTE